MNVEGESTGPSQNNPSGTEIQRGGTVEADVPLERSQAARAVTITELLRKNRRQWAAFADGELIWFADTRVALYHHCLLQLNLPPHRFFVSLVIPEDDPRIGEIEPHGRSLNAPLPWEADTPLGRSQAAYLEALPELLKTHPREWVAFADGNLVRFGKTGAELYQHCLNDLGLTHDRFVVRRVIPDVDPFVDTTRS